MDEKQLNRQDAKTQRKPVKNLCAFAPQRFNLLAIG
jgi:hypothetical protein